MMMSGGGGNDDDDVRVLDMFDEDGGGGESAPSRKRAAAAASVANNSGDGSLTTAADKRAARRAATLERRAAAKMAKDLAAEQKRAERTRMQVRAQALKLSRKMHAALAAAGTTTTVAVPTTSGGGSDALVLAPIVSRPNGDLALSASGEDPAGRFEQSFRTLQQIAHSAVMPPPPPPPTLSPSPPAALPGTPVRLPGVAVGGQQQQQQEATTTPQSQQAQQQQQQPLFGAIRGGALPTYREYMAQQENRPVAPRRTRAELELELTEDQRREQARLERELQELAVTQQYENLTRLYNTLPELRRKPIHANNTTARRAPPPSAVLLPRSVPQQRRTVRRVFHVGRTDKELSLLTHSAATRAGVDDFRMHVQSLSTDKMRRALLAAKLLRAGSEAPEPLVRRIFQQRQMLVGDLLVGGNGGGAIAAAGAEEVVSSSS